MKKILSIFVIVCTLLSMSFFSPITTQASELKDYRTGMITAVMNNETVWASVIGNRVESFFMDLNFDGKNEYIVIIYGQGIMISTRIFYYDKHGFSEATDLEVMSTIDATSFKYYFHQTENRYFITGTYSFRESNYITTNNYEFDYDLNNFLTILNYSAASRDRYSASSDYLYYKYTKGDREAVTEKAYEEANREKLKHCSDANVQYQTINYNDWKSMSRDAKKTALENSYDYFDYHHFRSLEIGKDTNQFENYYNGDPMISDKKYIEYLFEDANWFEDVEICTALLLKQHGLCHGIGVSMCLAKSGKISPDALSNGNEAQNYWEIGSFDNNQKFTDLLLYYQYNQHTMNNQPKLQIYSYADFFEFDLTKRKLAKLSEQELTKLFLKSLVNEAKYAQNKGKPFLFSYGYKGLSERNHTVAVVGYYHDDENNQHLLTIYDINSYRNGKTANNISYFTMTISDDYKSFSYVDSNHPITDLYNNWSNMKIYGTDQIHDEVRVKAENVSPVSDNNTTKLMVKTGKRFTMKDASGRTLSFNGDKYDGTINLYDVELVEENEENLYWKFTIDSSDSYMFTDMDPGFEAIGDTGINGFIIKSDGAKTVTAKNDTLTFTGDSYTFSGSFETGGNNLFVEVAGESGDNTTLKKEDSNILLASDQTIENTVIRSYSIDGCQTEEAGDITSVSKIDTDTGEITAEILCGDVNKDNNISIDDVTIIQRHLAEMTDLTAEQLALADVNGDNKVDINDATHLQKYLAEFEGIVLGKQS